MKYLVDWITEAEKNATALGHFNISTIEMFWAIVHAAKKLSLSVVIGVSEGERDFLGVRQVVSLVKSAKEESGQPIFLNADHTYSYERAVEAIDAGFDSVIIDGAKLSFEENILLTKRVVDYAHSNGKITLVEGELGYIGQSSKVLEAIPEGVNPDQALSLTEVRRFVGETGIDLLAPSIGNFHGMLREGTEPLHNELITAIREAAGVPLVLHGGSGISPSDFKKAIAHGIAMIHISTELRLAYRVALQCSLQENPDEVAPYKFLKGPMQAVERVVEEKLALFSGL